MINQKNIVLLVITVVLLVAGLFIALSPKEDFSTIDGVFSAIDSRVKRTYSNIYTTYGTEWNAQMGAGLPAAVEGYDFKLDSRSASAMNFNTGAERTDTYKRLLVLKHTPVVADDLSDAKDIVDSVMKQAGYTKTRGSANVFYDKDDTTCVLLETTDGVFTLSCSTPESLRSLVQLAEPFVSAYHAAHPDIVLSDITFGPYTVKDPASPQSGVYTASKTEGYKIAEAVVTVSDTQVLALFYQKDGEETWNFVSKASDEFGFRCGDFEADPDARKAFYDQVCLSETGHVRLDTDNRALQ